jgi:hypothetical protein
VKYFQKSPFGGQRPKIFICNRSFRKNQALYTGFRPCKLDLAPENNGLTHGEISNKENQFQSKIRLKENGMDIYRVSCGNGLENKWDIG